MPLSFQPSSLYIAFVVARHPLRGHVGKLMFRNDFPTKATLTITSSYCFLTIGPVKTIGTAPPKPTKEGRLVFKLPKVLERGEFLDIEVNLDPEHAEFPQPGVQKFQMQLVVDVRLEAKDGEPAQELRMPPIPVTIGRILKTKPPYRGIVAIDYGTTNTCAVAMAVGSDEPVPLALQAANASGGKAHEVASLAFYESVVDPKNPVVKIGTDAAIRASQFGSSDATIRSAKRYVGQWRKWQVGTNAAGAVEYLTEEIASHVVSAVRSLIEGALDGYWPVQLACTFPTAFNAAQVAALHHVFDQVQRDVKRQLGESFVTHRMLVDEATAAAVFYLTTEFADQEQLRQIAGDSFHVLCYDLGGGTTDLSLLEVELPTESQHGPVRGRVLARDGLPFFGGDNMTLTLFRMFKVELARRLAQAAAKPPARRDVEPGVPDTDVQSAQQAVSKNDGLLREWLERGGPVPEQPSIGYEGHGGVEVPDELWNAIDALVPTRYDLKQVAGGKDWVRRQVNFRDLWTVAEAAKITFGNRKSPSETGEIALTMTESLRAAFGLSAKGEAIRVSEASYCNHLEPHLVCSFKLAQKLAEEAGIPVVKFFVLAGNACRLPFVRRLFTTHMQSLGAVEGENILFDPERAKLAVAYGACVAAGAQGSDGKGGWRFDLPGAVLDEYVGTRVGSKGGWRGGDTAQIKAWFSPKDALPAAARIAVRPAGPRLAAVSVRRELEDPRDIGYFDFEAPNLRIQAGGEPEDLRAAIEWPGIRAAVEACEREREGADSRALVVVMTGERELYAFDGGAWFRFRRRFPEYRPELDPFSGHQ